MQLKIISSNIRFENENDGANNWPFRKPILKNIINSYKPDILGTQEGRRPQLDDLNRIVHLDPIWTHRPWIEERMYPSLFINTAKFEIIESGDFWLSETPDTPGSKSFSSAFPRLCTYAKIKNNDSYLYIFNTHLDHILPETRINQTKVLISKIKKINSKNYPIIVMGDFNEGPDGEVRKEVLNNLSLIDPWHESNFIEEGTHHKFDGLNSNTKRIDWILKSDVFNSLNKEIIKYNENNLYPSDHFPIFLELELD